MRLKLPVTHPDIPTVVSPLGIELNKPRAIWDGRYVNEFCRDVPFCMDNKARVAMSGFHILCRIVDMLGTTEQVMKDLEDEQQFQSALRAMVVVTHVIFQAGYFLGASKCNLIPENVRVYLGTECDAMQSRFLVPEKRIVKYLPILKDFVSRQWVSQTLIWTEGAENFIPKLVYF